jgi:hypothetical protein
MEHWDSAIEGAIQSLGGESFDSHQLILEMVHRNQRQYVDALAATGGERPFQTLHSALGTRIKTVCNRLGYQGQDWRSSDIFGQASKCIQWSRQ